MQVREGRRGSQMRVWYEGSYCVQWRLRSSRTSLQLHRVTSGNCCGQDSRLEHLFTSSHSPLAESCPYVSEKALGGCGLEV